MRAELAVTQDRLLDLFDYNASTGILVWRERPPSDFINPLVCRAWNTKYSGKAVIGLNGRGYVRVCFRGRTYTAHRLIFLRCHGWMPEAIDHINHNRTDNRIENLRAATKSINARNTKLPHRNTSGRIGVHWNKNMRKWQARIRVNDHLMHLGYYENLNAASAARATAEIKYDFHPNHGKIVQQEAA